MSRLLIAGLFTLVFSVSSLLAQSQTLPSDRTAIAALWNDLAAAVRAKDRSALEKIYTEDFVHVHAIGKIDDRKARLDVLLSGEATIDTATAIEVGLRKFGDVIVAVGKVSMTDDDGNLVTYSVTRLYVKQQDRWRFASSHASPVTAK